MSETVVTTAALPAAGGADAKGRSRSHQTRRRCRREGQPTFMPSSGAKPSHRSSSPLQDTCHRGARPTAVRGPIDCMAMSSVVSWHCPFLSTAGLKTNRVISSHVHSPQQDHANRSATPRTLSLSWRPAPRRDSPRAVGTAKLKSALKPGRCKFRNFSSRRLQDWPPLLQLRQEQRELCGHDLRGSGSGSGVRGSLLLNDSRCGRNLILLGGHGWQHHRRRGCKRSRIEAVAPLEPCSSGEPSRLRHWRSQSTTRAAVLVRCPFHVTSFPVAGVSDDNARVSGDVVLRGSDVRVCDSWSGQLWGPPAPLWPCAKDPVWRDVAVALGVGASVGVIGFRGQGRVAGVVG